MKIVGRRFCCSHSFDLRLHPTLLFPLSPPRFDTMAFALASRVAAVRPTAVAGRRSTVVARPARVAGAVVSLFFAKRF